MPVYEHGATAVSVVESLAAFGLDCIVVDDGSGPETAAALDALARERPAARLVRLPRNAGKGAAVIAGFEAAAARGFTHALLLDADGQHDVADVPRMLELARARPEALVLGLPRFDSSAPAARRYGRLVSRFWVWLETRSLAIGDPLCGFRCLPIAPVLALARRRRLGRRMDFDPEIVVRLTWEGLPVVNLPTRVRYFADGVSHFDPVRDNLRMTWLHTRLCVEGLARAAAAAARRLRGATRAPGSWHRSPERGSLVGLRLVVWLHRALGRRLTGVVVDAVVAYFYLTDGAGRRASRRYLARVASAPEGRAALGRPPDRFASFLHYREFGTSILDRLELWLRGVEGFEFEFHGRERLARELERGRGALLVGTHLGSFDAMRVMARRGGMPVNVLMYTRHAEQINRIFRELSPDASLRVIQGEPGTPSAIFEIRACLQRGEPVAILGDRTPPHEAGRTRALPFLGAPARFPEGPFRVADLLGCPIFFVVALRRGERRYAIHAEPLECDPRGGREARIGERMAAYVARLERFCASAPLQWFNFFDFWGDDAAQTSLPEGAPSP